MTRADKPKYHYARLIINYARKQGGSIIVGLSNIGSINSYLTKITLYRVNTDIFSAAEIIESIATNLHALQSKTFEFTLQQQSNQNDSYLIIAMDPITDPVRVEQREIFSLLDRNLLPESDDITQWKQLLHDRNDVKFELPTKSNQNQSWCIANFSELPATTPHEPSISWVYNPKTPHKYNNKYNGDRTQLRREFSLKDTSLNLEKEGRKGNLSVTLEATIYNHLQVPTDEGGLAIWISDSPNKWTQRAISNIRTFSRWTSEPIKSGFNNEFTKVAISLLSVRKQGKNSDSYFGKTSFMLHHRQIRRVN